ncbi:MAG: rRNA maturation RNase YbeY [Actinobacteria bacterium]|nr:rRNA maturation RNase YbeY [Actinomycetota bacterium]
MTIEITNKSGELVPTESVRDLLQNALVELKLHPDCELNLVFVDIEEMTELHIKWMDEGGPTDVLSFPMDMPEPGNEAVTLGDIVIAPVVAAQQAATAGHSIDHEIFILAAHGLLHILGYDHANPDEEKAMFTLQESLVKKFTA